MRYTRILLAALVASAGFFAGLAHAELSVAQKPLFAGSFVPPQLMLTMSNDNQLYFNAFPEYADLTGDGAAERSYNHDFDYFGYFDPFKCYNYSSSGRFEPQSLTGNKYCSGNWSGNFLNWLSMARIDTVRKILYGGKRSVDTPELTVLERTYLPSDAHSWVRYYDGDDLPQLTPFSLPVGTVGTSSTNLDFSVGPKQNIQTTFASGGIELGDQVRIQQSAGGPGQGYMLGLVTGVSGSTIDVEVTSVHGSAPSSNTSWTIENPTRAGISFCNVTWADSGNSQDVTAPPLIRVASGNYSFWTANERWQCAWFNEQSHTGHAEMDIGGIRWSNANDVSVSGVAANADNPSQAQRLGEYVARVRACVSNLIGTESCARYPNGNHKPIGLLQRFGEDGRLRFGLLTGTYSKNLSGGTLRKNIRTFSDEVDPQTGQFVTPAHGESIVRSLDVLRLYGYNHDDGLYSGAEDNCGVGVQKDQMADGRCMNWGNPQAEIFLEALRYFAGLSPNSDFLVDGEDRISGLQSAEWEDPLEEAAWCTPMNVLSFNASVNSWDNNMNSFPNLPNTSSSVDTWTNTVGDGEGLHGGQRFWGGNNALCTAKNVGSLSAVQGICPEAPNQDGTFHIAGLAHYAYTSDLRPEMENEQNVRTWGVSLAPAVPRIEIPLPGQTEPSVVILPACENRGDGGLRCALADFRVLDQDVDAGTGRFFIQWDVHEWGSDFDMDINGILSYQIMNDTITVTTETFAQSSSRATGFGYIISGTTQDGYHAHSGINNYNYNDPSGVTGCTNCTVFDNATDVTYQIGGGAASLLESPLYYAAKWGGYDKEGDFPSNPLSWDQSGDGLPDNYFFAVDPGQLAESLERAFRQVLEAAGTTAIVANSRRLDTEAKIYQARFDTRDWTGDVIITDLETEQSRLASAHLPTHANRNIVTRFDGTSLNFNTSSLPDGAKSLIAPPGQESDAQLIDRIIDYIRGDQSHEQQYQGVFRDRNVVIGDIVNSDIVFSGPRNEGWARLPQDEGGGTNYSDYVDSKRNNRPNVVFVGSNDGMLHAFEADGNPVEYFAYIPNAVLGDLHELSEPDYDHRYFVDGQVAVGDAWDGTRWRTILVGGLGAGGSAVFALDVTSPNSFSASHALWEIQPDDGYFSEMGYTFGRPQITRLADGTWVAIFGNGYLSGNDQPQLYVVDLFTGEPIHDDPLSATSPGNTAVSNGLSGVSLLLDAATRTFVRRAYAGDLAGNVWRFDLATLDGQVTAGASRLFSDGNGQPVTSPPAVALHPSGGTMVFVGTGKLFEEHDPIVTENEPVQSFYALRDRGNTIALSDMDEVSMVSGDEGMRIVSNNASPDPDSAGWYLPLVVEGNNNGERVLTRGQVIFGRVVFNTYQPDEDPCIGGGLGRFYCLMATSGNGCTDDGQGNPIGAIEIGPVTPSAPSIVILPPGHSAPGTPPGEPPPPGYAPGEPDTSPLPPGDEIELIGERDQWCGAIGVMLDIDNFVPFGSLCEGRQVWREIR